MAGSKVNDYAIGDSNIESVMLTLDKAYKGLHQVSLTNYDNTSEPQIAAGSVAEVNGALYKFDSNESITGSPSDGTVYIYLVPDGDTITAAYTNTAPTWSDSKQGWYGTGADANKRYLEFNIIKKSSEWLKRSYATQRFVGNIKDRSYVRAYRDSAQSFTGSAGYTLLYNQKMFDSNSEFNTSTGAFTAKRNGLYLIKYRFTLNITSLEALTFVQPSIRVNGDTIFRGHVAYSTGVYDFQGSTTYNLVSGDEVFVRINQSSATASSLGDIFSVSTLFEIIEL